ncbi:transmembrane emp24 domain-containing protein 3-like [Lethenteron reissneri]|uniref:transmembrane emp24 domain-containing protein 3-like n=1 Tax=Lethenteron reissneri TaxID=7753 RepID=UPI002AB602D5|nr:transmembrane emp24 domain-containing protein 3-like [Lethenteron reissneri]
MRSRVSPRAGGGRQALWPLHLLHHLLHHLHLLLPPLLLLGVSAGSATELTFELPDNARQCFYQHVAAGARASLEYQVITGGHYDVDCRLEDPEGGVLYTETRKQHDSFAWTSERGGLHSFCFSNEFSTFSHKTVYFELQVGDEAPLVPEMGRRVTALTQMESSCVSIHEGLRATLDYQTHHRLRESQGRARAEELRTRVALWSLGETALLLLVGAGQVLLLRGFFSEDRRAQTGL